MKKFLSLLLALAFLVTAIVVPVSAEGEATVVYYVNGTSETTVTDVVVGENYTPDHMPAAPSGKYFAGWKDQNGNYVLENGITLTEGENALYASFVDYPVEEKAYLSVEGLQTRADNAPIISAPSVNTTVEGTEKFFPSFRTEVNGGYIQRRYVTEGEGAPYITYGSNASGTNTGIHMLYDENGVAISGKYSTTYTIIVKFSVPVSNGQTFAIVPAFGVKYNRVDGNGVETYNIHTAVGNQVSSALNRLTPRPTVDGTQLAKGKWGYTFTSAGTSEYYMTTDSTNTGDNVNYIGEAGDTVHTAVYSISTSTAAANVAPYFALLIKAPAGATNFLNTIDIKEVTILDPTAAKVEYIENGEVVETVGGLAAGATYVPNRMAAGSADKYFAGWVDAEGNYALKNGFTLAAGTNKLYAKYVEYPGRYTSTGVLNYANDATFALPSYDSNGENFLNYIDAFGSYLNFTPVELDGETVIKVRNPVTWGARANFIIPNADGSAMQIVPGHKYEITVTYKVPEHKGNVQMLFGAGFGFENKSSSGGYVDLRTSLNTPFQGIVKNSATLTSTTDPNLPLTSTGWTYIWLGGGGHDAWAVTGASTEWQTATYTCSTSADLTGFLPILQGSFNLPGEAEFYVKEITVNDLNWVAPATVTYFVDGVQDGETITGLKTGDTYTVDKVPTIDAPEGKIFAGWADAQGNVVTSITLAEGDNKIYAFFKDATTVAYYVDGVKDGETITGLNEGDTFVIDRAPLAETPEGKFFAGWKDENGKFVTDGLVLTDGENKLTAVYKDYVSGTVAHTISTANVPKAMNGTTRLMALPSVVNGVYQGYTAFNGYGSVTDKSENGEPYRQYTSWADWSNATLQFIHDEEGVPYFAKPETTYKIEFTYRAASLNNELTFAEWSAQNEIDTEAAKAYRTNFNMYMYVGFDPSYRDSYLNNLGVAGSKWMATAQEHHTWYDHGPGMGFWKDVCADGWVTETFIITTKTAAEYEAAGYVPTFMYHIGTNHTKTILDVKSVVISEVVTNVNYIENGEVVATVEGLDAGATYTPDRMPVGEAAEGTYFAGWADENGKMVTSVALQEGDNNFTAVYKSYVDSFNPVISKGAKLTVPALVEGSYVNGINSSDIWSIDTTADNQIVVASNTGYTQENIYAFGDENGAAYKLEPNTTYKITYQAKYVPGDWEAVNAANAAAGFEGATVYDASSCAGRVNIGADLSKFPALRSGNYAAYNFSNDSEVIVDSLDFEEYTHYVSTGDLANGVMMLRTTAYGYGIWDAEGNRTNASTATYAPTTTTIKDIKVEKVDATIDAEESIVDGVAIDYIKVADFVEDKQTYKVALRYSNRSRDTKTLSFLTADADNFNSNQGFVEVANHAALTINGRTVNVNGGLSGVSKNVYITIDKAAGQGDALYIYIGGGADDLDITVESVTMLTDSDGGSLIGNDGVAMLNLEDPKAWQALRYYFTYDTTTGADIVIDGVSYPLVSRGFLLADAAKIGGGEDAVTRAEAAKEGSVILDSYTTDFTKCWNYVENVGLTADGAAMHKVTYSTYVKGFKPEEGTFNNTQKLYVKGYVVVLIDGVEVTLYTGESCFTVKEVADLLGRQ